MLHYIAGGIINGDFHARIFLMPRTALLRIICRRKTRLIIYSANKISNIHSLQDLLNKILTIWLPRYKG